MSWSISEFLKSVNILVVVYYQVEHYRGKLEYPEENLFKCGLDWTSRKLSPDKVYGVASGILTKVHLWESSPLTIMPPFVPRRKLAL